VSDVPPIQVDPVGRVGSVPILGKGPTFRQRRRARAEAKALLGRIHRQIQKYGVRLTGEVREVIEQQAAELAAAVRDQDHDRICAALPRLDELYDHNLGFGRKSTFREYADSIGVAVLVALFLRTFVVEAFKIPTGSMIPTMQVGDHIFVNKFLFGLHIPFTKIKFFELRKPQRGEVIVFIYPVDPSKDFIKRVVAVEGDTVQIRADSPGETPDVIVNGRPLARRRLPGPCHFWDFVETLNRWEEHHQCDRIEETNDGRTYLTIYTPGGANAPRFGGDEPFTVPRGTVFVMGDNRNNSHDSRYWGTVPLENVKGKAMVVWWSQGSDVEGVRWGRLGHVVE
jgi:signal peptidase I